MRFQLVTSAITARPRAPNRARPRHPHRTPIVLALLAGLLIPAPQRTEAYYDEPVTTTIVVVAAAVTITTGVIWLWDRIFGGEKKVQTVVKYRIYDRET
ncbi:MAG: hypothetical protein ACF8R7_14750, partial [Phycisphaerales bacterium JB039]